MTFQVVSILSAHWAWGHRSLRTDDRLLIKLQCWPNSEHTTQLDHQRQSVKWKKCKLCTACEWVAKIANHIGMSAGHCGQVLQKSAPEMNACFLLYLSSITSPPVTLSPSRQLSSAEWHDLWALQVHTLHTEYIIWVQPFSWMAVFVLRPIQGALFAPAWTETILKPTILHYKHSVSYWNTENECVCSGAVSTVNSSISAVTRSNEEHNSSLLRTHLFLFPPPALHCTESVAAALPPVWRHRLSVSL